VKEAVAKKNDVVTQVEIPKFKKLSEGKVRTMFDLGKELLIVTTDRISAFDVVLPNGIPDKGRVLNNLSKFWFDMLGVEHHLISTDLPKDLAKFDFLKGRSMVVKKAKVFPIECVARGYLMGSGWKDYQAAGKVCGHTLPKGLKLADKLPEPIFTPTTKETTGHDINIDFEETCKRIGKETATKLRDLTLSIYKKAHDFALTKGVIIADTKFEFGLVGKTITLVDEVLTPDSSRFWPAKEYKPGSNPPSFDKQFVRDYLESIKWDKKPPAPKLPDEVIQKTAEKYREAYRLLTGKELK
jgi:phosphoribosylaminoimidazole-succinocarboxamide synthase